MGITQNDIIKLERKGYRYVGVAGRGSSSSVIRLQKDGKNYACKISDKIPELQKEGNFLKMIEHAAFPKYYDFLYSTKKGYLVMEYVGNKNLEMMMKNTCFEQKKALAAGIQIAEGLRYLHNLKRPLLYRDLKAENIVPGSGGIKIVDMGSVAFEDEAGKDIVGTWGYAPPEQMANLNGETNYKTGRYSDVYSFGRLMHYMLTGDSPYMPPFNKPGIRSYDNTYDRELERLINSCVRENPYERFPDMDFVLQELETIYYRMNNEKHLFNISVIRNKKMGDYLYEKNIIFR
jgi:serine/threonine-protein kinase